MGSGLTQQTVSIERKPPWGILEDLAKLEPETIIREKALAEMCNCHPQTIKRYVTRGEFPPPVRLGGKPCWTVRSILEHIEERLRHAKREAEAEAARLARIGV
ncbi:MAG TPA: hypothetical protein PLS25_03890 [Methanoregulaceae archaeon]|nr:hypothetical protein [Methanoregulaceae archaeon]HOH80746.1 hypothetical protein [Methanoregulaceae archaeon]